MNEIIYTCFVLISGFLMGVFFYVGLWITVKKSLKSTSPAPLFLVSFIIRIGLTLVGIYIITSCEWKKLLVCLSGFIISRMIITRVVKDKNLVQVSKEVFK